MPLQLIRNDLTMLSTDAIVNAANEQLSPGGGVCGAIFQAAGYHKLHQACRAIGHCSTGRAVITPGFDLPAKYIIHAVGPVWRGGHHGEEALLASCYRSALELASQHELQSIAFPLISGGIYGYPHAEALRVAVKTIRDYLYSDTNDDLDVYLVLYSSDAYTTGSEMFGGIRSYISQASVHEGERWNNRVDAPMLNRLLVPEVCELPDEPDTLPDTECDLFMAADEFLTDDSFSGACAPMLPGMDNEDLPFPTEDDIRDIPDAPVVQVDAEQAKPFASRPKYAIAFSPAPSVQLMNEAEEAMLKDWLRSEQHETTFSEHLLYLIDQTGEKDATIYKRANIDRRLFSKIRSNYDYQPSKSTALALCMALRLTRSAADELLNKAGYALTTANPRDCAVIWCIDHCRYDVFDLNTVLFDMDLPGLGA